MRIPDYARLHINQLLNLLSPLALASAICAVVVLFPNCASGQADRIEPGANKGLLWRATNGGLKDTSWIYAGTHLRDRSVFDFGVIVLEKIRDCEYFLPEFDFRDSTIHDKLFVRFSRMPGDTTLEDLIGRQPDKLLKKLSEKLYIPAETLNTYYPKLTADFLKYNYWPEPEIRVALIYHFSKYALEYEKEIARASPSIENHYYDLRNIPLQEQADFLQEKHELYELYPDTVARSEEKLRKLYLQGDLDAIRKLFISRNSPTMESCVNYYCDLYARRFQEYAEKGSVFALLPAHNLGGADGILERLRKSGYTVTAVPVPFDGSVSAIYPPSKD